MIEFKYEKGKGWISERESPSSFILNKSGQQETLRFDLDKMRIEKKHWDGKWRIVIFDIPEKIKTVRDAIRYHLKRLGFVELQKSIFTIPFECEKEIEFIVEFYKVRKHVRFIVAESIDNELDLKNKFGLIV